MFELVELSVFDLWVCAIIASEVVTIDSIVKVLGSTCTLILICSMRLLREGKRKIDDELGLDFSILV